MPRSHVSLTCKPHALTCTVPVAIQMYYHMYAPMLSVSEMIACKPTPIELARYKYPRSGRQTNALLKVSVHTHAVAVNAKTPCLV